MSNKTMRVAVKLITDEALGRGIKVSFYDRDYFYMQYGKHIEYFDETLCSKTTATANKFCLKKHLTKYFLKQAGVSVPEGEVFYKEDKSKARDYFINSNKPLVIKPCSGAEGDCIFINVAEISQFERAWGKIIKKYSQVILEKQYEGEEYRIFATRNKALSIVKRMPANVLGDGVHTIKELVQIKNKEPQRAPGITPMQKIKIDSTVKNFMSQKGLSLNDIPKRGQRVFLRGNSNIATGGDSVECSDIADKSVFEIAQRAVESIPGLLYAGIDFMTKDISKKQQKDDYCIIEVNSQPGIALHHYPYIGKPKNIAKVIIDEIFPETMTLEK